MNQWVPFQSFPQGPVTTGNICEIYGVPVEWIAIFPEFNPVTQYLSDDIVLGYQKYWLRFRAGASNKKFEEETKYLKGRPYFDQQLSFRLYWQSGLQHVKLNNLVNHRWVFLIREATSGIYYVIGKPDVGAQVTVKYANGGGTITDIQASFRSIHRAPLYTGVNRSLCRVVDENGDFIIDEDGNYLAYACDMVTPPEPGTGEFSAAEFLNSEFFVP